MQLSLPIAPFDLGDPADSDPLRPVAPRELVQLHRRLADALGEPLDLVGTNNRRTMLSWRRDGAGLLKVRLQRHYARADDDTLQAIADFISTRDPSAGRVVRNFARKLNLDTRPVRWLQFTPPLGRCHDLRKHLDEQNRNHFDCRFSGRIGWSRRSRGRSRRSIRLGSWNPETQLIRIHPALDRPEVPDYVVGFVVFHELLHAVMGSKIRQGRKVYHSKEFRHLEQAHPDHDRAELWIQRHLEGLLSF